jgi:hypothetical protein
MRGLRYRSRGLITIKSDQNDHQRSTPASGVESES